MMTTIQFLDRMKDTLGSDYKTAKALGVTTQRVSQIRTRGGIFTDEQGLKIAEILGYKQEFVILSLAAERAEKSPAFSILKTIADRFEPKNMAAALLLCALALPVVLSDNLSPISFI